MHRESDQATVSETAARELAAAITHCNYVVQCKRGTLPHPCRAVVETQRGPLDNVQVPEPWSGHLHSAPILFIASNPSISFEELYPTWTWPEDRRVDYFVERFAGGPGHVEDGNRFPLAEQAPDGSTHSKKGVAFWSAARNCASLILDRAAKPGVDYALTEVVHCKSRAEQGVAEAAGPCTMKWMERIVALSPARIVVIYGDQARKAMTNLLHEDLPVNVVGEYTLGRRSRLVITLRHPNYFGPKRIDKVLAPDVFDAVRREVAMRPHAPVVAPPRDEPPQEQYEQVWPPAGSPTLLFNQHPYGGGLGLRITWTAAGATTVPGSKPGLELLGQLGFTGDVNDPRAVLEWAETTGWDLYPHNI